MYLKPFLKKHLNFLNVFENRTTLILKGWFYFQKRLTFNIIMLTTVTLLIFFIYDIYTLDLEGTVFFLLLVKQFQNFGVIT